MARPGRVRPIGVASRMTGALRFGGRGVTDPAVRAIRNGGHMSAQSRIESLQSRHASLEDRIGDEDRRPLPDRATLTRLKLEKLRLKEELERMRGRG
jgi:hypothetical protein